MLEKLSLIKCCHPDAGDNDVWVCNVFNLEQADSVGLLSKRVSAKAYDARGFRIAGQVAVLARAEDLHLRQPHCCDGHCGLQENQQLSLAAYRALSAQNFVWAHKLMLLLAKECLCAANERAADGEWPGGQPWEMLGNSSQMVFKHRAREIAQVPINEYRDLQASNLFDIDWEAVEGELVGIDSIRAHLELLLKASEGKLAE